MTNKKVLIAYDGSHCADAALEDLRHAGLPRQTEALVVSVADLILPPPPPSSYEVVEAAFSQSSPAAAKRALGREAQAIARARSTALQGCEIVQALFPHWKVSAEAYADTPAWSVIKRADEWKPDLIVVGSHGRSGLGRFFLGSVSQQVVTEARCSVRVGRGLIRKDDRPVRIAIGVDGSPDAEAAIRAVVEREWPEGSEARVITVLGPLMIQALEWVEENSRSEWEWAQKVVDESAAKLRAVGLDVSYAVKWGEPKHILLEAAEEWEADCIFVGARGLRRLERFLLGSVSTTVATRAKCSVEVVRSGEAA